MTKQIAVLIWGIGVIAWYVIRHPFVRRSKKTAVSKSLLDSREWILLTLATVGLFIIPAIYALTRFPAALDRPFIPALAWLGALTMAFALWLFRRSHADLGRNWSASLKVREEHELVTGGVYRLVRHPMYSSFFLLALAQCLLLPNWLAGLAGFVGAGALYAFRVTREEQMMLERFGDAYRSYMAQTKRIIPWVL
jgi:protein-S-isoprenylcysteine O-methyltransferase Ste14